VHPFVALMRTYCIDYTNSHDQSLYDQIMEPDYVVNINGMALERDTSYARSVERLFAKAPGLGLLVHDLVLNGDRLSMYFSEHSAMPGAGGTALACWRGIGLYKWNGARLTENFVEQDYMAMQEQLATGRPHPLTPPHIDPWVTTEPISPDAEAEAAALAWLGRGDLTDSRSIEIDDMRTGAAYEPVLDVEDLTVNDLFSAGSSVPFHVTFHGAYRGGLGTAVEQHVGAAASLDVVGIARMVDGAVDHLDAVTGRTRLLGELTKRS
jgi:hypothetical protein